MPRGFISRFIDTYPQFNKQWITEGAGTMTNETEVVMHDNTASANADQNIAILVGIIKDYQERLTVRDEQISHLIALLGEKRRTEE